MTNDMLGGIVLGFALALCFVAIFQVGVNIGVKNVLGIVDGEYPAAYKFLDKHKSAAKILPYVMGQSND